MNVIKIQVKIYIKIKYRIRKSEKSVCPTRSLTQCVPSTHEMTHVILSYSEKKIKYIFHIILFLLLFIVIVL